MTIPDHRRWSKPFWQAAQRKNGRLILVTMCLRWHRCDDSSELQQSRASVTIRHRRRGMRCATSSSSSMIVRIDAADRNERKIKNDVDATHRTINDDVRTYEKLTLIQNRIIYRSKFSWRDRDERKVQSIWRQISPYIQGGFLGRCVT